VPLSDSGRAVAWLECDLVAWQNARIAARNASIAERNEAKAEAVIRDLPRYGEARQCNRGERLRDDDRFAGEIITTIPPINVRAQRRFGVTFDPMSQADWSAIVEAAIAAERGAS
jgi:hypothetical protein